VDKGLTHFMRGRARLAVVLMVCMVAIVALPAFAHAAVFSAEFPAPGATLHGQPAVVSVDVAGAVLNAKTGVITVNGIAYKAYVAQGAAGSWASSEALVGGVYKTTWTWVSGAGVASLSVYPNALAVGGPYAVTATVKDTAGNVLTDPIASWSFSIAATPTPPAPPVVTAANQTCRSANCHGTAFDNDNAMGPICSSCHVDGFGAHGFNNNASGHNTTLEGKVGAYTKFDGTQGVTLTWTAPKAFTLPGTKTQAALSVPVGSTFTTGQVGVVNSNWDFPTASVFWPTTDDAATLTAQAAPAGAIRGLTASSVITCEDCHTSLVAAGPQGAAAANFGLDSRFPADYSMAGLTKKVTSGSNVSPTWPGFSTSGIYEAASASATRTTPLSRFAAQASWTDGSAVICAKCHRLETAKRPYNPGAGETSRTIGTSGLLYASTEGANTAHDSHHQDTTDGTAQCVSCHVAIPHGWKAPRLLVDVQKYEGTPYVSENAIEDMGTLAALNNHPRIDSTGFLPYSTSNGTANAAGSDYNIAHVGTVIWDESQCDACGDHYGNLGKAGQTDAAGIAAGAVPVRIDEN